MLKSSIEANQALKNEGIKAQKNTTEGDVQFMARELQEKDPTKLKESDLISLLEYSKNKLFADGSYIPVRVNTPRILIAFAMEQGYTLENNPIAMRVYKARQAMSNAEEWDGNFSDTPHNLTSKEIVEIIRAMDNPAYLVFQTKNERFAEIVKFNKGKEKAYAIIDFFDVNKNAEIMNGYKGGKYNILVTVYPSEDAEDLNKYLKDKKNKVITGEEMKKKGLSQRGLGSYVPALLNDSPFYEDSITQLDEKFKENSAKNSDRDSLDRELTKGQADYFKDSVVRDGNGNLMVMYHGSPKTDISSFRLDLGGAYFTSNPEYAKEYGRNGKVYEVYLNITKPFDTRKAKDRAIFENEFYVQDILKILCVKIKI